MIHIECEDDQYESDQNLSGNFNRGGRKQMKLGTNRRNARERNRVKHLNDSFEILRQHIPVNQHQKKLSKVDTLRSAMIYIENLRKILNNYSNSNSNKNSNIFSRKNEFLIEESNKLLNIDKSHCRTTNNDDEQEDIFF